MRSGVLFVLFSALVASCTVVDNLDNLSNGKCPSDQKVCNSACVSLSDPATGCGTIDSCSPCAFTNGAAKCESGKCAIATCSTGFDNCDKDDTNGCESDINSSVDHCGSCTNKCASTNGTAKCESGKCAIATCSTGFDNCDKDDTNGCESDINGSVDHCGSCTKKCTGTNGTAKCETGTCKVDTCTQDFYDCNGSADDGCEVNLTNDKNNCGTCGTKCRTTCQDKICLEVSQISHGNSADHTCAVLSDGTARCWGQNANDQLGKGTACSSASCTEPTPVPVQNLKTISAIATGQDHSCAVLKDGNVWCWGANDQGQLGTNQGMTTSDRHPTPEQAQGIDNVQALSLGTKFSCALKTDKTVWCWGINAEGQLGHSGNKDPNPTPTQIAGLTDVTQISAGTIHACALKSNGTVWCWGHNENGELGVPLSQTSDKCWGNNNPQCSYTPVQAHVPSDGGTLTASGLTTGGSHTCVVNSQNQVLCTGLNNFGQLGFASPASVSTLSASMIPAGYGSAHFVVGGKMHTCSVQQDNRLWCWGWNNKGQVGSSPGTSSYPIPTLVSSMSNVGDVGLGKLHSCALTSDKLVYCWGDNSAGQLGTGSTGTTPVYIPAQVTGLP